MSEPEPKVIVVGSIRGGRWETYLEMQRRVYSITGIAPTLRSRLSGKDDSLAVKVEVKEMIEDKKAYLNPDNIRIRKLTGKECFRLMGFTDEDYEAAAGVVSESRIYEQAGNSIVVPVLEAIFREMI